MINTTKGYQNHIVKSLRNDGWDFGKGIAADDGWKVPLINKEKSSFLLAVHTGFDNAKWNLYGSLQDIREWELSVNKLTDDFVIRDYVNHVVETSDGDDSMRKDTPQEVALNVLWVKNSRNK